METAYHSCCSCLFLYKLVFAEPVITVGSTDLLKLHSAIYQCVYFFLSRSIVFSFTKASKKDTTQPCLELVNSLLQIQIVFFIFISSALSTVNKYTPWTQVQYFSGKIYYCTCSIIPLLHIFDSFFSLSPKTAEQRLF